jgi:chromosome segregation ATPase
MWKRGWLRSTVWATLALAGCATSKSPVPDPDAVPTVTITLQERDAIRDQLMMAAAKVQQLERRLSVREKEIAAAQSEIDELRTAVELTDLSGLGLGGRNVGRAPTPPPGEAPPAPEGTQPRAAAAPASAMELAELKRQLADEKQKRAKLERDLKNLKMETSSGPFETRTQKELEEARAQIERLEAALKVERQARERISREYEEMKARPPAAVDAQASDGRVLAAFKANQERVLATMQRQLEESQQREGDLRAALSAVQGQNAVDLATTVADLEAENDALQTRLDGEHLRNQDLAAKLRAAMRTADMIFRMNSDQQPAAAR